MFVAAYVSGATAAMGQWLVRCQCEWLVPVPVLVPALVPVPVPVPVP